MEKILRFLRYLSLPVFLIALLLVYAVSPAYMSFLLWENLDKTRFFYTVLGVFLALQLLFQLLYMLSMAMNKGHTFVLGKSTWTLKAFFHTFILSANLFLTLTMLYMSFFNITSQHGIFYGILYIPLISLFLSAIGVLYMMLKSFSRHVSTKPKP